MTNPPEVRSGGLALNLADVWSAIDSRSRKWLGASRWTGNSNQSPRATSRLARQRSPVVGDSIRGGTAARAVRPEHSRKCVRIRRGVSGIRGSSD